MQIKTYTKCVFPNLDPRPSEPCCSGMHPRVPCWGMGGTGRGGPAVPVFKAGIKILGTRLGKCSGRQNRILKMPQASNGKVTSLLTN